MRKSGLRKKITIDLNEQRNRKYFLPFYIDCQEVEDILSCISIALAQKKKGLHKDSPKFWKAIEKLNKKLWKILK
jgi:hypothetical protein